MKEGVSYHRKTRETDVFIKLALRGQGNYKVETDIPFFNHMLETLAKHSGFNLTLKAKGDQEVDYHHTVEDVGLVLGKAFKEALAKGNNVRRFGWAQVPMDEALVGVAVDLCGRSHLSFNIEKKSRRKDVFDISLVHEFFIALVREAKIVLHINLVYGRNLHHIIEAIFKGVAIALRLALEPEKRIKGSMSTKGVI